jgi:8-oxo-dGTP diphosphatase
MSENRKYPSITADTALFSIINKELNILLIKRGDPPFKDMWALPGGFIEYSEEILTAAERELFEETNLKNISLMQFQTFGRPSRDPRGRTISVVFVGVANFEILQPKAGDDAKETEWFSINALPSLAFDHSEIISGAVDFLRQKIESEPILKNLMNPEFSMSELQEVYEIILDKELDHGRFKVEILKNEFLEKKENSKYKFKKEAKFTSRLY